MARTLAAIRAEIRAEWATIVAKGRVRREALAALPKTPSLLGSGTKTEKGEGEGYLTAVVYMAPAGEAFESTDSRTLCAFATGPCFKACLGRKSGRMVMRPNERARLWKAALYMGARNLWRELLAAEIRSFQGTAERAGYRPVVRIDGSTDTGEGERFAPMFPGVTFYDYTKVPTRALRNVGNPNYSVTFSYSGENMEDTRAILAAGGNVATVFAGPKSGALPKEWIGHTVIDGDVTDLRFTDPIGSGYVVGLTFKAAKGRAAAMAQAVQKGFVVDPAA